MKKILIILFLFAFVWRLWLTTQAKHGDMYNNIDWGIGAVENGLSNFYDLPKEFWPHSRPNQPPGSIIFHYASHVFSVSVDRLINQLNGQFPIFPSKVVWWWQYHGELVSIKLPSLLADFLAAAALVQFGVLFKRFRAGCVMALVYLFNPVTWYISSFWGQTDSIVAALSLWSLVFLFQKRLILSPFFLGLSLITKASWIPLIPFYLFYFLKIHSAKWYLLAFVGISALMVSFPFHPKLDLPIWLVQLFSSRIISGESSYITVNAFNFWNLIYPPNTIVSSAEKIGYLIVIIFLGMLFYRLAKNFTPQTLFKSSMLIFFSFFLFAPRMHERYLFPVFPLLSVCLLFSSRQWIFYSILSGAFLLNLYSQWWAPGNLWLQSFYTEANTKVISMIFLTVFAIQFLLPIKTDRIKVCLKR